MIRIVLLLVMMSAWLRPASAANWDYAENNYDPAHAYPLVAHVALSGLNFVCPQRPFEQIPASCMDTDWFVTQLRAGRCYRFATQDLAPGVDTNLIIYGAEADRAAPLAGNDNATTEDLRSAVDLCLPTAPDPQRLYILVGQVGTVPPPSPIEARTYTLLIETLAPPTPTATATATTAPPTATPRPTATEPATGGPVVQPSLTPAIEPPATAIPTATASATTTPVVRIRVVEVQPTAKPQPTTPLPEAIQQTIRVGYDRNRNKIVDTDEGVRGVWAQLINPRSGAILAEGMTDARGTVTLSAIARPGRYSVVLPALNLVKPVQNNQPLAPILISATAAKLPAVLP